ncbi:MAG: TetR/AcrR family transcriptional regulator [Candidatus Hydrogenedentota bacterium]
MAPRRAARDVASRREQILDLAVDEASSHGLEGLTIGRLSSLAGMSKSGLFAHFGSKEELQVASVQHARDRFREEVWERVDEISPGVTRLRSMLRTWIEHIECGELRGGCFFAAASSEFDGRPGPVRDNVAQLIQSWVKYLEKEIDVASGMGQLRSEIETSLLAFELHACVQEANLYRQLFRRDDAFDLARTAIDSKLHWASTDKGRDELNREIVSTDEGAGQ